MRALIASSSFQRSAPGNCQRSVLPSVNKKPTVLAMEETRRGLVPYEDLNQMEALEKLAAE